MIHHLSSYKILLINHMHKDSFTKNIETRFKSLVQMIKENYIMLIRYYCYTNTIEKRVKFINLDFYIHATKHHFTQRR